MICRQVRKLFSRALVFSLVVCASHLTASAANIAWVTFHSGDDTPSMAAGTAGFTEAPDVGYTDLLAANGHNVTRVVTRNLTDPVLTPDDMAYMANLNTYDLVIIGRSVASGNFQQGSERVAYHGLTVPTMMMSGFILRNNRLQFHTGDTIPDTSSNTAGPVSLTATQPSHPIFDGITLDGANSMSFANAAVLPFGAMTVQRGISVVTDPVGGGGTVLATVGAADVAASIGGPLITHWKPGAMLGTSVLAGHRMAFLSGSREHDGLTAEGSGIFDLSNGGGQLFLNAVDFMVAIPEPSTATMLLFVAIAGFAGRRRR